jgi:hypothetical protein
MRYVVMAALVALLAVPASAERLVRIHDADQSTILSIIDDGLEIASSSARDNWVDVYFPDREIDRAAMYSSRIEILPREWGMLLEGNRGNAGYYYSWEENNAFWATLAVQHSDLVDTPVSIGTSYQGRTISQVLITSNASGYKPALIFTALTHAREPGGNSALIDFANWLTTNYGSDTMATWILDHTRIYMVPIVNPDTYILNCNPYGGMLRKNQRPPDGVDLNRNYPYQWGYDDSGSSPDPYSETYRGASAGSEPETQAVMNFINAIDPIAGFHMHTYGEYLIHPWNYNNSPTPDEATFDSWSSAMTQYNGYDCGRCGEVLGYNSNGDADDWGYWSGGGHPKCMIFTPEVSPAGFWGGQTDTTLIASDCAKVRYMCIWLCMNAPGSVGVEGESGATIPGPFSLGSISPNPVVTQASLGLVLPRAGVVEISVFDLLGRRVADLESGALQAGQNTVQLAIPDALPSGVYSLRASYEGATGQRLFTILR